MTPVSLSGQQVMELTRTQEGPVPLKYLYLEPAVESDELLVMFSGFHGRETEGIPGMFNYVRAVESVEMHRLFILDDYQGLPCYYIGRGGRRDYEVAVATLIFDRMAALGIEARKVTLAGSSKGGSAAVYFAVRYGFGRALPGGAQYRVGSYLHGLSSWSRNQLLSPICGTTDVERARDELDTVYADAVRGGSRETSVTIHIGSGDPTREKHIAPLVEDLAERGIDHRVEVDDYANHGELATYYPPFLLRELGRVSGV